MDWTNVIENNLQDHLLISEFDRAAFDGVELCLGIDEAGRGPVLGPMVYSALFCPTKEEHKLKEMECADSKALTEKDREKIFDRINEQTKLCGYATTVLSPHKISTRMLRKVKYNLNEISHDTAISLIDVLYNQQKLNIVHVYLDTVGDPTKYEQKLSKIFPKLRIKVSKKADALFPCVSAASICAKVTRDAVLKRWKYTESLPSVLEYGSGYPGDPLTKKFLESTVNPIFGFVKMVRFSWSTAAKICERRCVQIKWQDMVEGDAECNGVDQDSNDEDAATENCDDTKTRSQKKTNTAAAKKAAANTTTSTKHQPSKMAAAVATDKNNGSILNFFQKSAQQKRPINATLDSATATTETETAAHVDVQSRFLLTRKLKIAAAF